MVVHKATEAKIRGVLPRQEVSCNSGYRWRGICAPYARQTQGPGGQYPKLQENEQSPVWFGLPVSVPETHTDPGVEDAGAEEDEVRVDELEDETGRSCDWI